MKRHKVSGILVKYQTKLIYRPRDHLRTWKDTIGGECAWVRCRPVSLSKTILASLSVKDRLHATCIMRNQPQCMNLTICLHGIFIILLIACNVTVCHSHYKDDVIWNILTIISWVKTRESVGEIIKIMKHHM